MTVPAIARARNIVAGTIGTIPLKTYDAQEREIAGRTIIDQPDPAVPRSVTYAWLVDSIMFHGVGFLQVIDVSPVDGRPARARWVDPLRVTQNLNDTGTMVVGYAVDGRNVPNGGLLSLIRFDGLDEGVLVRGARTVSTAIELESAAYRMASEPVPSMVLTNRQMNLDPESKASLLSAFKQARRTRATAYVEGDIELQHFGFDSAQLQLVEARQHTANEIARLMGVPSWYLNAESASATYSNVTAERRSLVDFGLRAYLTVIEERLSMNDVTPNGNRVRFDLDDFLRGDASEQARIAIDLATAGIMTIDEARDFVDLLPTGTRPADDNATTPVAQTKVTPNV
jgi:HK97 family phage portal protein